MSKPDLTDPEFEALRADIANDLLTMDLEYRLTLAHLLTANGWGEKPCECVAYLTKRRTALVPWFVMQARKDGSDYIEKFVAFRHKVHQRHLDGETLEVD